MSGSTTDPHVAPLPIADAASVVAPHGTETAPEPYVPLRKSELVELLVRRGRLDAIEAESFRRLCTLIEMGFHFEFHATLERLKRLYAPFDPETDTHPVLDGERPREQLLDECLDMLARMLEAANYRRLTHEELERAMTGATYWGIDLEVDTRIFDRLLIFARGDGTLVRTRKDIGTAFRRREVVLEGYERLVLAIKMKRDFDQDDLVDTDNLHLKMFREIPKLDLEMLLPGTRPRMQKLDVAKITVPSATGLWSVYKMWLPLVFGAKLALASVAVGLFSYAAGTFFGYRRQKEQYTYCLVQRLYYQNLDNNSGVFCRVIDEAEDEQTKEAILCYYFLWKETEGHTTLAELRPRIEGFIESHTGIVCAFQLEDAFRQLERLGAVELIEDAVRACPLDRAVAMLTEHCNRAVLRPSH
jgi:hypothetical protein